MTSIKILSNRQQIFDVFLRFFLIGSMSFFWPGMMAYEPQMKFFQYSSFVFLGLSLWVPPRRKIVNPYLVMILFYGMFHTLMMNFTDHGQMTLFNMFCGVLIIKIIAERVDLDYRKIGILVTAFIVFNLIYLVFQYFDKDPIFSMIHSENQTKIDMVGIMGIRFALGALSVLATPFLFHLSPWLCIIVLPLLWIGKSSTCVATFLILFSFLMYFKNKWICFGILLAGLVAGLWYIFYVDAPTGQFEKRLHVWFAGLQVWKTIPWFGRGLGAWAMTKFTTIQQNGQPQIWWWAHNDFLQYLFEQGIAGMILLYAYFKNMIRKVKLNVMEHRIAFAGIMAVSSMAFWHFPFHIARLAGFSILIIALIEANTSRVDHEEKLCACSVN